MGQFPVAQGFFSGDTILKQHGKSRVGLLRTNEWASGRALTPMTVDQSVMVYQCRCPQLIGSCIEDSRQKVG